MGWSASNRCATRGAVFQIRDFQWGDSHVTNSLCVSFPPFLASNLRSLMGKAFHRALNNVRAGSHLVLIDCDEYSAYGTVDGYEQIGSAGFNG